MAEEKNNMAETNSPTDSGPSLHVAPGPHLQDPSLTTRRMMIDVLIALAPAAIVSLIVFRQYAAMQMAVCITGCCVAEAVLTKMRNRPVPLSDFSAVVTGLILALSMPALVPTSAFPFVMSFIGAFMAIFLGKFIFGGLGFNIFNPAMVGRAFIMLAFSGAMAASGYMAEGTGIDALSSATPMTALKEGGVVTELSSLVLGNTNGSLGETSALACMIGGLYLCIRRTASWEIPAGILAAVGAIAGVMNLCNLDSSWTVLHTVCGGALLFGAFFIATDPVTSPLTPKGKIIFGLGTGTLIMLIRTLSAYPEGVMFAVLLMNALAPLINRWTVPRPFGAVVEKKVEAEAS